MITKDKPTIPLEKEIQNNICEWLHFNKYFFWRSNNIPVFGRNNGGKMTFRAMPKYSPKGLPDIIVVHKGKFVGIEVKREEKSVIREDQLIFGANLQRNGGAYYIVHSLDQVLDIKELKL